MKEIKKLIKEKSFYKVYLLTGDEPYLILHAKHMLKNGMIREGDTMNYAEFTDAKVDINTLQELAFTQENGVVSFILPALKYWTMIVAE